ncbi:MAG: decaprenyl-phosphate phosphoribosyltransferase [SAR202 cluster bacterium]|nr:decaprenyl-phosphate phosphoribosyltransferase [SAR202 cluster bacterium]|tara:strand:- start:26418 stop:27323 length:906 start_codon:yes stop_codon:yes gene_type:complete
MTKNLANLIISIRPKQWTKNLILYIALPFSVSQLWAVGDLDQLTLLLIKISAGFIVFCAISGSVYIINDIFDKTKDSNHLIKKDRPIASGDLPIPLAISFSFLLLVTPTIFAFFISTTFTIIILCYWILMILYSLHLKKLIFIDLLVISIGFILRAIAGAVILQIPISPWLYVCTGLGALFIGSAKRRSEISNSKNNSQIQRETLKMYSASTLDQLISIFATSTLMSYVLYSFLSTNLPSNHSMMLTIPFVIYGILRYINIVYSKNIGEFPEEIILSDKPLITTIVLWIFFSISILVIFRT